MPLVTISYSFMEWCRKHTLRQDGPRLRSTGRTLAIGVRFAFELLDLFIGQYAAVCLPHCEQGCFEAKGAEVMEYTAFFVGVMNYLEQLTWGMEEDGDWTVRHGSWHISIGAFPAPLPLGDPVHGRISGSPVFCRGSHESAYSCSAFSYLVSILNAEVASLTQSTTRRSTFLNRLYAVAALYEWVEVPQSEKHAKLSQWNYVNRRGVRSFRWSAEQEEVLAAIQRGTNVEDRADLDGDRYFFVSGEPGAGKSEVLIHGAVRAAEAG